MSKFRAIAGYVLGGVMFVVLLPTIMWLASGMCTITKDGKTYNLYGKVKIVDSFEDIKVKIVDAFEDADIKIVDAFEDSCGKVKIVEHFEDVKVKIVDSFEDIKIKIVDAFEGVKK